VATIALDLGYASASAFIAMFRRMTGVTPDEQRTGRLTSAPARQPPR
jgi:AraC-like DNA-binding protein